MKLVIVITDSSLSFRACLRHCGLDPQSQILNQLQDEFFFRHSVLATESKRRNNFKLK